jgi:hypothetical protein
MNNSISLIDDIIEDRDETTNEDIIEDIEGRLNIDHNVEDDVIKYEKSVSKLKKSYDEIKTNLKDTIDIISCDLETIHENNNKAEIIKNIDSITKLTELKMKHIMSLADINKKEFELSIKGLNVSSSGGSKGSEGEKGLTTKELKNLLRKMSDNGQSSGDLF